MGTVVETIFFRLRREHGNARDLLARLDPDLLHVAPSPGTTSIAVLVHHFLGAETQIVRQVAGVPAPRDRDAEFGITAADVDRTALEAELNAADRLLDELGPRIGPEQLAAPLERSAGEFSRVCTGSSAPTATPASTWARPRSLRTGSKEWVVDRHVQSRPHACTGEADMVLA